jgi:hypothetical protein
LEDEYSSSFSDNEIEFIPNPPSQIDFNDLQWNSDLNMYSEDEYEDYESDLEDFVLDDNKEI